MAATTTVFVYTMNRGLHNGAWSRYVFPWNCEHFTHLENLLYIRHGDIVSYVQEGHVTDNGTAFDGVIQWPWLDFGAPGVLKKLLGFDIIGEGTASLEIGYDQSNGGNFTASFAIPPDSVPGEVIPFHDLLPSMSIKITYDGGQVWRWDQFTLYLSDERPTS